jgi:hypothetical protein
MRSTKKMAKSSSLTKGHVPKNLKTPLDNLPTVAPEHFRVPDPARLAPSVRAIHAPRILLLYGSLRSRSFSRLVVEESARLLEAMGADTRIFSPAGLPLVDDAPESHPKVQELQELARWSEGMVWCSPERHGAMTGIMKTQIDWIPLSQGWLREEDLNLRPLGYEPNELPGCSIARQDGILLYLFAFGCFVGCFSNFRAINQFNQAIGCIVTHAETHFQDARVATWTGLKRGPRSANSLVTTVAIAQAVKRQALVGQRRLLGQVIMGSTTRRSSLALGTVVLMTSCSMSEFIMLRSIARRCSLVRLSLRSPCP